MKNHCFKVGFKVISNYMFDNHLKLNAEKTILTNLLMFGFLIQYISLGRDDHLSYTAINFDSFFRSGLIPCTDLELTEVLSDNHNQPLNNSWSKLPQWLASQGSH